MNTIIVTTAALAVTAKESWNKPADKWVVEGDYGYLNSFSSYKKAVAFAKEEAAFGNEIGRPTEVQINA
jgi:hypothetical protein